MYKKIALTLFLILIIGVLSGCSSESESRTSDKLKVVTTVFPQYDWVREIVGENNDKVEVEMLQDSSIDLHNYQPTTQDIVKISESDLFIYVGGESDHWVSDALKNVSGEKSQSINLVEALGSAAKSEEVVEGMQDGEHSGEESAGDDDHEHTAEVDEHVWLSLKNAKTFVSTIADKLATLDSGNGDTYKKNAEVYIEKLTNLDKDYEAATTSASQKTLLFGDRFPFRYLVDDYGLNYYAAFSGCSAETEASFETISFLAKKVDELSLKHVMTIEGTNHKIAETIVENTAAKDMEILVLNSMQGTTSQDVSSGATYVKYMESNLSVLKQALS